MRQQLVLASILLGTLLTLPAFLSAQPGPPTVPQATVVVDCDAGDTLAEALETRADELTIEFTGTCSEELVINRDRLTIRGLDASATVTDDPAVVNSEPAFLLQGADLVLQNFIIDGSGGRGIRVQRSSGVLIENLVVRDSARTGLTVEESSSVHVIASTFIGNVFAGVAVWGNSNLTVTDSLEVSDNGIVGLLLSTGSALQVRGGNVQLLTQNQLFGVAIQIGATGQFPTVTSVGNLIGMVSFGGTYFGSVDVTGGQVGVFLTNKASFDGGATVSNGGSAVQVTEDSTALLRGGTLTAPTALFVFNGVVEADGVTFDGDIDLQFNAQAFFDASTTTGTVSCFPSALAGGSITCPSPLIGDAMRLGTQATELWELPHPLPLIQPD